MLDEASAPAGTSLLDYTRALADHARELGLEVPIYTTGANFFVPEPEREVERVCRHIDIAAGCGIKLLRHDVAYSYGEYKGVKTYRHVIEKVAPYIFKRN